MSATGRTTAGDAIAPHCRAEPYCRRVGDGLRRGRPRRLRTHLLGSGDALGAGRTTRPTGGHIAWVGVNAANHPTQSGAWIRAGLQESSTIQRFHPTVEIGCALASTGGMRKRLTNIHKAPERSASGTLLDPVRQTISCYWRNAHYGGHYLMFLCSQCHCSARVLYARYRAQYHEIWFFMCRACAGITYQSTMGHRWDRSARRVEKLRAPLKRGTGGIPAKPRGMHKSTYGCRAMRYNRHADPPSCRTFGSCESKCLKLLPVIVMRFW